ncbi:MAG: dihydropteroate synthase [Veillonellaceae bacterium]|nr:dihydropteroate synthase [Veillonellaceae bacterium]
MIKIFDGAMGTMLQQAGLAAGACPELWNLEKPEAVTAIHRQYIEHGANIIETNTFGANRIKLAHYGLADKVQLLNTAAVNAARQAAGSAVKIAGSVGPTGKFIAPLGELAFEDAYQVYKEQISALTSAGVDMILIETIIDIQEMRAALLAAKAVTDMTVICQLSFGSDGRTVTGTDPVTAAILLDAMGADVIGANCSLGPAQLLPIAQALASATTRPISIQANAGMPQLINGETVFPMGPDEMAAWVPKLIQAGVSYLGGCCGTTPAHIKAISLAAAKSGMPHQQICLHNKTTAVTSRSKTVFMGANLPTVIIGERINPTGRKQLSADIKAGNFASVKKEALQQIRAGAHILDVNMGVPGINQAAAMAQAVNDLSMLVDAPLAIDTSDTEALEAGLRIYPGRALINSVSAEPDRLEQFLPLAKKYGAAILCLPLSDKGVPATASERVTVARHIIHKALEAGLRPQDFVLDALVLTVAADEHAAAETLKTLRLYRKYFGYPTTMGLSNISYGLPQRELVNASFAAMALSAGLDAPILNPYNPMMKDTLATSAVLLGYDRSGRSYSKDFAARQAVANNKPEAQQSNDILSTIRQAVIDGEKESIVPLVRQAISQNYSTIEITDKALTAAMNIIGEDFGAGRCFLPQVLLSAETMRAAFTTIKETLPSAQTAQLGTVVLATVKGDIHDLGKNIVAALLENNGFKVIDLGKDVAAETIVDAVKQHQADVVGLCALMTTTMPQIDQTIKLIKDSGITCRTMVGGAVLTAEYAQQAGADAYASDGVTAVKQAKKLIAR